MREGVRERERESVCVYVWCVTEMSRSVFVGSSNQLTVSAMHHIYRFFSWFDTHTQIFAK